MKVWVIAHNTFRETIRDKVLRMILGLCIIVILASKAIAEISLGQDLKVIADFSLGAIDLFGLYSVYLLALDLSIKK